MGSVVISSIFKDNILHKKFILKSCVITTMIFNTGLNALNILFHILFHRKLYCSFWDEGKQLRAAQVEVYSQKLQYNYFVNNDMVVLILKNTTCH